MCLLVDVRQNDCSCLLHGCHCCFSVYLFHLCRLSEVTCAALLFAQSLLSVPLFQLLVLFVFLLLFELSLSLSFDLRNNAGAILFLLLSSKSMTLLPGQPRHDLRS